MLCLAAGTVSCLDVDEPDRLIAGVIRQDNGFALSDAVVSVSPEVWTTTDADGTFELRGSAEELQGPLTATAPGFTAWTLDTESLVQFTAQLASRNQG
ncbi:MAG: carboxypeptidase-like regulatory domain-containing protein, partial [Myxococcota bacterium]